MVSYEEALEKVREIRPDYNHCAEKEDAYIFSVQPEAQMSIGGSSVMVVLKEDGSYLTVFEYTMKEGKYKEPIREFDIE